MSKWHTFRTALALAIMPPNVRAVFIEGARLVAKEYAIPAPKFKRARFTVNEITPERVEAN